MKNQIKSAIFLSFMNIVSSNEFIFSLTIELQEKSNLKEQLVDAITNKEEIIKKMEKGPIIEDESNNRKTNIIKLEEEIENLKEKYLI